MAPSATSATWSVRAPLAAWLREEAARAARAYGRFRVLDVGCGEKPYRSLFAPHAQEWVGVDPGPSSHADLRASADELPVPDGTFEVVLCTQMIHLCPDPDRVVRELARVVAPGGVVLASTHGVQLDHASTQVPDLWRWTHEGLRRLFAANADWRSLDVWPGAGTAACLAMLAGLLTEVACRRLGAPRLARAPVWALNRGAAALDARSALLREPGPGTIFANLHVRAEAPA